LGNPFLSILKERPEVDFERHLDFIVRHVMEDRFDAVYLVTGYSGFGKSSLAIDVARRISKRTGQPFSVKPVDPEGAGGNIVYPGQCYMCVQAGVRYLGPGSCIIVDEAVSQADSRKAMTQGQKATMALMDMVRYRQYFFFWLYRHRSAADLRLRAGRALFELNVKATPVRGQDGLLRMQRGRFDLYWHEKLGNLGPFESVMWFNHANNIPFDGLDGDPEFEEYNYYKDMFSVMAWANYEAPWQDFPYEEGAQVPSVEEMIPYALERERRLDERLAGEDAPPRVPRRKAKAAKSPQEEDW